MVQRGRTFYDLDRYLRGPNMLEVVTDVVKLSKNRSIVSGNGHGAGIGVLQASP